MGFPTGALPLLLQSPQFLMPSPSHLQRLCLLECKINREVGFQRLGLIPFTPRLDMPPPQLCRQQLWPHSLTSSPLPLQRRNTTKAGKAGPVTSSVGPSGGCPG